MRLIVSGTGTGVGKTVVSAALTRALSKRGPTKGIKPYETGVVDIALDAQALEEAAGAKCRETYFRAPDPLAPAAFPGVPGIDEIAARITRELEGAENAIVESAGGLFVPLAPKKLFADLAALLGLPIILVTYDGLGTLSHTLAAVEAAQSRGLEIASLVLNQGACEEDPSRASNKRLLQEHCSLPVLNFPDAMDGEARLDAAAEEILGSVKQ